MADRPWALIVNPAAGHGAGYRLYRAIRDRLQAADRFVTCLLSEGPGHAGVLARQARETGASTVVALGGDGTVHEVLNGLSREASDLHGVSLGIVPVGTGNSFLRDFGIAGDAGQALDRILSGASRLVDIGHFHYADGGATRSALFLNILGIGYIADVCYLANRRYKHWGALGYTMAALQSLRSLKAAAGQLAGDGGARSCTLSLAAICNSQFTGGAMWIAPTASTDDARLNLVILESGRRLDLLRCLARVFDGRHLELPQVTHTLVRSLEVICQPPLRLMPDGEVYGTTPVQVEIWPGALRLLV